MNMGKDLNKFYRKKKNGSLELLENYLLSYSFRRGFSTDMNRCPIVDLYINENRHFELFFVWYKFPSTDFIESNLEGELPDGIDRLLHNLGTFQSIQLKDSYTDSDDTYVADDIQRESITINHRNERHYVDLSPHYFRKSLIQTSQEKLILELYIEIDLWLIAEFNKVKTEYT